MADFLENVFGDAQPEADVEPPAPTPEPEAVAEAPTPEPETPEVQAEPVREAPQQGYVPIAAMMDERDKRKAIEAENRALREQQARPQAEVPDPFDNPGDYTAYMKQQLDGALQQQKVDMSWAFAVQQHGEEQANKAKDWALEKAQNDPGFAQMLDVEFKRQPMPIDWIVQQHKRDALLSDIGDVSKLDDWFAREAAKRGYAQQSAAPLAAPVVAATKPAQALPPRSIASDTAQPTAATVDDERGEFLGLFSKR